MTYIVAYQKEPGHKEHRGFITYSSKVSVETVVKELRKDKTIEQIYVGKIVKVK